MIVVEVSNPANTAQNICNLSSLGVQHKKVRPVEFDRQLPFDARPVEDLVDRVREPALEMRVVRAEHQAVLAERARDHIEHRLVLMRLDVAEDAPGRELLARQVL